jgi:RNA polymerase sigma factor (sigma-70 family)
LRGDLEQRFTALMESEGAALARLAASYAREPDDREDLFQDIAVAIWRALPRFRGECSERTFLFRIAHNRGIAHIARRRLPTLETREDLEVRDASPDPEQSLSAEQEGRRLRAAVLGLPVGYRQVVTLALEGMSYAEIADVLGIAESNVGARLTRARQVLRMRLKGPSHAI